MKRKIVISLVLVLALAALSFVAVSADDPPAMVYVGHGIPGQALGLPGNELPVDVLVNNALCLLEGFEFGEFVGPVELPAGTYNIKIFLANVDDPCNINDPLAEPVIEADVPFEAGVNYTVFAHLTADGDPTASLFENDVDSAVAGYTRLTVRHTAAAPAVDINLFRGWARGRMVGEIEGLENPEQAGPLNIRPGAYEAAIFALAPMWRCWVCRWCSSRTNRISFTQWVAWIPETFTVLAQVIDLGIVPPPRPAPPVP
jgi:hypothetical protein